MKRIKKFGVYQTSKVVAINLFVGALIFVIPFGMGSRLLIGTNHPGFPFGSGLFFFLLPILYGVISFIITALACMIYNFIAEWTGGIEIEIDVDDEPVNEVNEKME